MHLNTYNAARIQLVKMLKDPKNWRVEDKEAYATTPPPPPAHQHYHHHHHNDNNKSKAHSDGTPSDAPLRLRGQADRFGFLVRGIHYVRAPYGCRIFVVYIAQSHSCSHM